MINYGNQTNKSIKDSQARGSIEFFIIIDLTIILNNFKSNKWDLSSNLAFFFVSLTYHFRTIMVLRNFLPIVALRKCCLKPCFRIHLEKLISLAIRCFPLYLLLSVCLGSVEFSKPYFFILCSRNFNCLFLMLYISISFVFIVSKILSLLLYSVHNVLSMLQ